MDERKATTYAPGAALFPIVTGLLAGVLLVGCQSYSPSAIDPQGPAAARIADLWWILLAVGSAIFVLVMAILVTALLRHRGDDNPLARPPSSSRMIILGGVVMPLVVLSGVLALTVNTLIALSAPPESQENIVEVVGHQFWWEVRYPGHNIVTANEIHIPAGRPVQVRLTSHDVIHSFWIPELHGKLDMIPGQTNRFWLQADNPGEYKGLCAEFCGVQHAKMNLLVIAQPEDDYATWLTQQQQPARVPGEPLAQRGLEVFLGAGCVECHTVRGTDATGTLGPELTHVASRRTLGAGILPNNRGNLGGWIADPQHIKPGNLMPSSSLRSEELQALLVYVETLR